MAGYTYKNITIYPVVTEKTTAMSDHSIYAFKTDPDLTKQQMAAFIKEKFQVEVASMNVANMKAKTRTFRGKVGRTKAFKKYYVKLKDGKKIELM